MKEIESVEELAELFKSGVLNKEDGDVIVFDKSYAELYTGTEDDEGNMVVPEKPYGFAMSYEELVWDYFTKNGVNVQGA